MNRLLFWFHEILEFFRQRKYALQHFAVTQALKLRIIDLITAFSSWFTEQVFELPTVPVSLWTGKTLWKRSKKWYSAHLLCVCGHKTWEFDITVTMHVQHENHICEWSWVWIFWTGGCSQMRWHYTSVAGWKLIMSSYGALKPHMGRNGLPLWTLLCLQRGLRWGLMNFVTIAHLCRQHVPNTELQKIKLSILELFYLYAHGSLCIYYKNI
jgi:hypothetical protein